MRTIFKYNLVLGVVLSLVSCSLDENPVSDYSELTIGGTDSAGSSIKYTTRAQMKTQYEAMYNLLQGNDGLERWNADYLVFTDTHADNAYRGATDAELTQMEQQKQNGINKNIERDWNSFYNLIGAANRVICNVDSVPDQTLTAAERKQWKSEALILRSFIMFDMVRMWGGIPLVLVEPPAINAKNIVKVYPLYYPPRDSVSKVYTQIIQDLNIALEPGGAPDIDPSNKFIFSKTVANALLAKVYAEQPVRDYSRVLSYCEKVEQDVSLVANYGDLFEVNDNKTDVKFRNTSESIFEISFSGGGNWNAWLYGVDMTNPNSTYDWAKWLTPSRDLIAAFDKAGDVIRKNVTIVYATVSWSNEYPSKNYPFMHKCPSGFSSVIKLRLADILLLKAEAYVELGDLANAAATVNKIRKRANLPELSAAIASSKTAMADAVLNERRLELAFEGQRWFDLVRTGKVLEVMNTLNSRDVGRLPMDEVTQNSVLLPLPQSQIDINPHLVQNLGY
jgi:starch-binding outer membrane protein, SusD/RagB family